MSSSPLVKSLSKHGLLVVSLLLLCWPTLARAGLDSPFNGANLSGVGDIHGWICEAGNLTYSIDNGPPGALVYGVGRGDTQGICGDTNNGFIQQFNWNLIPTGQHTIRVFNNGQQFDQATFSVVNLGVEFLTGASGQCTTTLAGQNILLGWQQNLQNYSIIGVGGGLSVSGTYATSLDFVDENCNFISVPPDLPTHINSTLHVNQTGNQLSVISGSVTLTGTLEADGDFTVTAPPSPNTTLGCTYALVAAFGGNFLDDSLIFVLGAVFVSGNCTGLSLPCSIVYTGSFNKVSALSDGSETGAGVDLLLNQLHQSIQRQ